MGVADGLLSPHDAIKLLPQELQDLDWAKTAKKSWKKGMGWKDAMGLFGDAATIVKTALPVLFNLK